MRQKDISSFTEKIASEYSLEEQALIIAMLIESSPLLKRFKSLSNDIKVVSLSSVVKSIYNKTNLNNKQKELQAEPYRLQIEQLSQNALRSAFYINN